MARVMNMDQEEGFTLIELLVVLAITAMLLMVALPSYQHQILKMRRLDGQTMLIEIQGQLERYLFDNKAYPKTLALVGRYGKDEVESHEGHYKVKIDSTSSSCPIDYCYVLRAKPKGMNDANEELELHSNGAKIGPW